MGDHIDDNLTAALMAAVPLEFLTMRHWSERQRIAAAHAAARIVAEKGDVLQFPAKRGQAAPVFAALAKGLAAAAYQPGGITAFGQHWCGDHQVCQAAEQAAADAAGQPFSTRPEPPRRPIVDIPLPAGEVDGDA